MSRKRKIIERVLWIIIWTLTVRPFPRNIASKWEIFLLRIFGAKIGKNCVIYSSASIWLPRNLEMGDGTKIADHVRIQNSKPLIIKTGSVIAQYCYICDGSHAVEDVRKGFSKSIIIGERSWIGAESYIGIGVKIGRGCAIGARSVVRVNTPPYSMVIGNPAKVTGFVRDVNEIVLLEKEIYSEDERISLDVLNKNYNKFFVNRFAEIKNYLKI